MITIKPLSDAPSARDACIRWNDVEWGTAAGFSLDDWDAEYHRIEGHPTDEVFVAHLGAQPVGMVWLLEHEGVETHMHLTPWLSCLVVDPAHRDKGVAAALIRHIENYAAAGGDDQLYLLTETPAIYFAHGWEVFDTAPLGGKDVFVMRKVLAIPAVVE